MQFPEQISYSALRDKSAYSKPTYLVDVDGTLCQRGDRNPFDYTRCGEDTAIIPVVYVIQHLQNFATIVVLSGRNEKSRLQTSMWLHAHEIFYHQLFMRVDGDERPDYEVKRDIYLQAIKPAYANIMGVFDDRLSVIRNWFELGLFVFNVNNNRGEF